MQDATTTAFINLFTEAFQKCFGTNLHTTLSETESKHFSNRIFEETGLVIGAKSLKNYSFYILNPADAKPEKPSVATLDTLARYVLNAPYTDEIKRKEKEAHYPYWFQYRNRSAAENIAEPEKIETENEPGIIPAKKGKSFFIWMIVIMSIVAAIALYFYFDKAAEAFTDDFHTVDDDSLKSNGWFLQMKEEAWWNKRNVLPSHLTLFTLPGDNWTDSAHEPGIKNLLLRKINADCFTAEIHLDNFVPLHEWQQAGILLLEDTTFKGKSLRLSLAYNDFFGGYNRPKEIIIQAIYSNANDISNPEEIIHLPVFNIESGQEELVANNLRKSALQIEKNNNHFRFLYATGQADNFAFKEALHKDIDFHPRYIGIFALQGFVNNPNYIPACFTYFHLQPVSCTK